MESALDPGEEHTEFVSWAETNGVIITGVAPARFANRGMGIVAAQDIKEGDTIVHVQTSLLVHCALPSIKRLKLPSNATVHGKLAASLGLWYMDSSHDTYDKWQRVLPTEIDFKSTMPLYYLKQVQDLLPHAAKKLLNNQQKKLNKDWTDLKDHIPSVSKDFYTYTWLIVNTRTFYWDYPDISSAHPRLPRRRNSLTVDDCYAMCPFMDYFNHSDVGCDPKRSKSGYTITANCDYKAGEEVLVSYGSHTNDFLLIEYGFMLNNNKHDSVPLDHLILPILSPEQVDTLKEDGFYGNYTLSSSPATVCYRTQAVLRLIVLDSKRYSAFVGGDDGGLRDQARLNKYLIELLTRYCRGVVDTLDKLETTARGENKARQTGERGTSTSDTSHHTAQSCSTEVLEARWKQIQKIINTACQELES